MTLRQSRSFNPRGLLHDHLDGSAAMMDILPELYRLAGRPYPFASADECRAFFGNPYGDIVAKFGAVTSVLQSREALQMAAEAYVNRRAAEGYRYVETKFAPQYHCAGGLTMREVVTIVTDALVARGNARGLLVLPVICIGRETTPEMGVEIAKLAMECHHEVALNLVCDEANHPPEKHAAAYNITRGWLKRDSHAGEWVLSEPSATYRHRLLANVAKAYLMLRADGVGHAIPLIDDWDKGDALLIERMVDSGVRVTSCPASYVQSGLIDHVVMLGLRELIECGIRITVNPDDDLFLPNMTEVRRLVTEEACLTDSHLLTLERNVALSAFHSRARAVLEQP